jgi:transposase
MAEAQPTASSETQWAAFAAIDWGNHHNVWRMQPAAASECQEGKMENTPEAVDTWAAELYQRFGGRPVAVCLEQKRGALVYMLSKYAHLVLFPVHPTTAAQYREMFAPSGAKDDRRDAASLLDLLVHHRDRLHPLQADTVETRLIQFLAEERRRLVDLKTAQMNRLTAHLKMYFPQVLRWFDDVGTALVGDLLQRWPTLQQLQRTNPARLRRFFHEHNCRNEKLLDQRVQEIYAAKEATRDEAVLQGCSAIAQGLVGVIASLRSGIAASEKRLEELLAAHPDGFIFASLPGAGKVLAPRMIAALGTLRERFGSAQELECQSGIAPVTTASSKNKQVHFRWACPKFVRQTFHEFAGHSIAYCPWARAYYEHQRKEKHQDHHPAVRSLAFKWIRIIYRCWKDHKAYDDQLYVDSLRRRGSLLANLLPAPTGVGWETVAGFQKFSAK